MSESDAGHLGRARSDAAGLETIDLDGVVSLRESHRVMRAYFGQYFISYIGLSFLVTLVLFLLLAPTDANTGMIGLLLAQPAPLRLALGLTAFGAIVVFALIVLSWFQFIPRQVAMLWPGLAPIGAAFWNINLIMIAADPMRQSLEMTFGNGVATVLSGVISLGLIALTLFLGGALCINAWRLVAASADNFFVARGWRPQRYTPATAIRRMLGVPTYASALERSRITVLLLFLLAGVLGAGASMVPIVAVAWILSAMAWAYRVLDLSTGASGLVFLGGVAGYIAGPFIALQVLALLGRLVTRGAQRIAANGYQSIREWDDRAPILYLRSFAIDTETVRVRPRDVIARLIGLGSRFATLDETVLDCAAPYGPVIAIGDPRDPVPPLGAARTFVRGNDWQTVVADLAGAARLIVLATDTSAGVRWEVDHVLSNPALRAKTLFLASPSRSREEHYEAFGQIGRAIGFAHPLPDDMIALSTPAEGRLEALTSPTLSSDAYAIALNSRLVHDFGQAVDFPNRRSMGARVASASAWTAVAGAGAAAIAMLAMDGSRLNTPPAQPRDEYVIVEHPVGSEAPARVWPEFDDCDGADWCPRMIEIQAGGFDWEQGQMRVEIGAFAVGKIEVTRGQWAAFVTETAWPHSPMPEFDCNWREAGWEPTDADPVVCVNWNDAQQYVRWLSRRTGHRYRLLTNTESEYVARAGLSLDDYAGVPSPNEFGLLNLGRDPWEWVQDCNSYGGYTSDGSPDVRTDCEVVRMVRGGDIASSTFGRRHMIRNPEGRDPAVGFRVARTP